MQSGTTVSVIGRHEQSQQTRYLSGFPEADEQLAAVSKDNTIYQ